MAKDSFIIYTKFGEQVKLLSDTQIGILFRALIDYQSGEKILPKMDGMTNIVFSMIRQQIDFDNQKYEEICKAKSEAGKRGAEYGKLGGRPTKRVQTAKTANGVSKTPQGVSKTAKTADNESDNEYDTDIIPPFYSPLNGEKKEKTPADEFFEKYPRYAKDRSKMRVDVDYKRLLEEFEKSSYLRSLYTVKQINEIYPCILTGDYRDKEKTPSAVADADAKAKRERWYSVRRNKALTDAEKIHATFMKDEQYAKRYNRLREIEMEQGQAEARGEMETAAKLERERNRLRNEKRGIIERQGMTEEDLEPKWHCKKCEDTGFINSLPCDCYEGG